jgi:hypothetical protein
MRRIVKCIYHRLPEVVKRLIKSYLHSKKRFSLRESPNVFTEIYEKNIWHSEESKSGEGSELAATVAIRKQLPVIIAEYSIAAGVESDKTMYLFSLADLEVTTID